MRCASSLSVFLIPTALLNLTCYLLYYQQEPVPSKERGFLLAFRSVRIRNSSTVLHRQAAKISQGKQSYTWKGSWMLYFRSKYCGTHCWIVNALSCVYSLQQSLAVYISLGCFNYRKSRSLPLHTHTHTHTHIHTQ